jgi:outer membrane protein
MNRARCRIRALTGFLVLTLFWLPSSQLKSQQLSFPERIHRYFHPDVVNVEEVQGLNQRIADGKLHLHLKDFLELVMKNSPDIRISRLDVYTASDLITAAKAPLDPLLTGGFNTQRIISPQYTEISGAETLSNLTQNSTLNYQQTLPTGQTVTASFIGTRNSGNSSFNFFNPNIFTGLNFALTQPLIRDFNRIQLRGPLEIARTEVIISSDTSAAQIADLLTTAARQYWDAIGARDFIGVQQQSVNLAQKSYERDKKALDLGALGKLDIYQSQTQVAERSRDLIAAQYAYQGALDGLRRLIGADLTPQMRNTDIVLEDDPAALPSQAILPFEEAITKAMASRPEMHGAQQKINVDDINARIARNVLLPRLDLSAIGGSTGLGGDSVPAPGIPSTTANTGLGDALRETGSYIYPTYGFGLQFTLPLRNSLGQAALSDALVNRVRDKYDERRTQQQIILDVRQAIRNIELARATIEASARARDIAKLNVDAEQKKYELGSNTAFEVLDSQSRLANAESFLLTAYVGYQQAYVSYQRATWTLLDSLGVVLEMPKSR